ncbi:MAG: endolytic transglycosylase MltG [Clostridiales bacterium]|nr:endolytic transglycosylase MltG [Clostridiales bacterium]MBR6255654.1 endolytic transglycosylase MltG [Clostridiales bacterium]MCR5273896.1 endolytic transglycosylase MltG [Clostridiales bacterium]
MFSRKVSIALRVLIVVTALIVCGVIGVFLGYNYVLSQNSRFKTLEKKISTEDLVINQNTPGAVMIVIRSGDTTGDIAEKLKAAGLIKNTMTFSIMSKFNGFDGGYLAGTHFLTPDLTYDEMMYLLCQEPEVVRITFPEGITYKEVKAKLKDKGLSFNEAHLDECMNSPDLFVDYPFVSAIATNEDRDFILSGYLFPDTYDFDMNASEEEIISTFLRNMNSKLYGEFYERAEKLGMTVDEVITLASLIQKETTNKTDMLYISAVFHNRLNSEDPDMQFLGSDASINYLREQEGMSHVWAATAQDLEWDNPYNTYKYRGLPPGPICMPSLDAIQAALYPEPNCSYMYFCAKGDGRTAFAVTKEEHEANVEKYKDNWNDNAVIDDEGPNGDEG